MKGMLKLDKKIKLQSIDDVKKFINISMEYPNDVTLTLDKYVVDGKSIMSIFSLDLNQPITLSVSGDNSEEFFKKIECFTFE